MAKYKRREDGRYAATITTGFDENGKRCRRTVYGKTIAEVDEKLLKIKTELKTNTYVQDKKITFGEYTKRFLRTAEKMKEPRTYEMYEYVIKKYGESLNDLPLISITRNDLQEIVDDNAEKKRTCQKIRVCFNVVFKSAMADNLIYKNPCDNLQIPQYHAEEKRPLTSAEKTLLRETDLTMRQRVFVTIGQYYGLRKEEICALRFDSFDFDKMLLYVKHACVFLKGQPHERSTKNHDTRTLKIFPMHKDLFMQYLGSLDDSDPHIFRKADGRWITQDSFRSMWASVIKRMNDKADELKLPHPEGLTCHVLRHEFATSLYYAGIPALEAQKLTGHKSLSVLMEIYTHLDDLKRDPRDQLMKYYEKLEKKENRPSQKLS